MALTPKEYPQKVDEQLSAGASFIPKYVREYFIDNLLKRVFAYLFGWDIETGEPRKVAVNPDGSLRVTVTGESLSINDTKTGTAPDAYGARVDFDVVVSRIDIFIWDNAALLMRSMDGNIFMDEIEIPANSFYGIDARCHSFKIKNKSVGFPAVYQIIGWY